MCGCNERVHLLGHDALWSSSSYSLLVCNVPHSPRCRSYLVQSCCCCHCWAPRSRMSSVVSRTLVVIHRGTSPDRQGWGWSRGIVGKWGISWLLPCEESTSCGLPRHPSLPPCGPRTPLGAGHQICWLCLPPPQPSTRPSLQQTPPPRALLPPPSSPAAAAVPAARWQLSCMLAPPEKCFQKVCHFP